MRKNELSELGRMIPGINIEGMRIIKEGVIEGKPYEKRTSAQDTGFHPAIHIRNAKGNGQLLPVQLTSTPQVWVDLGCGTNPDGFALAKILEGRGYIGVDPYHAGGLLSSIAERDYRYAEKMPCFSVQESLEDFLKRLPNCSVSFILSNVDNFIMGENFPFKELEEACENIGRALHPRGTFITKGSVIGALPEKKGFEMKYYTKLHPTHIFWYEPT